MKLQKQITNKVDKSNLKQIHQQICLIEQLLKISTDLSQNMEFLVSSWESSVKNYFSFIEFYKNIQNIIAEDSDLVTLKLKIDRLIQSNVNIIKNYDFEAVQTHVVKGKISLESVKADISEIEGKLNNFKLIPYTYNSFLNSVDNSESQEDMKNSSILLENELDELLFSTQRPISKQSNNTISKESSNSCQKASNWDNKLANEESQAELASSINSLKQELENLKFKNMKFENEVNIYRQKWKLLNDKLENSNNSTTKIKQKWEEQIASILENHNNQMVTLQEQLTFLNKKLEISNRSDEIIDIVQNLSIMFLSRSEIDSSLTEKQKYLFKSLFGDTATDIYKSKIEKLQIELTNAKAQIHK